ncbi:MAG: coproporphyrinogen dehydrogenase HemZ, partial [bacterium]
MNVGVCLNKEDFFYDLHSLVKAFFPDDEVQIFSAADIEKAGEPRDLRIEIEIPEYTDRTQAKNALKQELYRTLKAYTGQSLPWGTLSGIRPTKIPTKLLLEGRTDEEVLAYLSETYLVSESKAGLALAVAKNEQRILTDAGIAARQPSLAADAFPQQPPSAVEECLPQPNSGLKETAFSLKTENDPSKPPFCLYAHIPFCPSICLYCTFSASPVSAWAKRADEYLEVLLGEMRQGAKRDLAEGKSLTPLVFYIGGGTPTALTAGQLDHLLTETEKIYDLSKLKEYTVEAGRPDSIDSVKLRILKDHGVGRISVNPQTMNQKTLDLIGRRHTVEDTERAFALAREAGFDNINMDIILGLPGEEPEDVRHTLERIRQMQPDELTVHSLAVKRASRLTKTLREAYEAGRIEDMSRYEGLSFQNSEEIIGMAYETAYAMGMKPYYLYRQKNMKGGLENTGFALPGKEGLYNILIMEELTDIRAYGAGASSKYLYEGGR